MKPSPQQDLIYTATSDGQSILINSVAGSGKTTTLVECSQRSKSPFGLALAYNVAIKEAIAPKLGRSVQAKTLNAAGFQALMLSLGKRFIKPDSRKLYAIARKLKVDKKLIKTLVPIVRNARNFGLVPEYGNFIMPAAVPGLIPDTDQVWESLFTAQLIKPTPTQIDLCRSMLIQSIEEALSGTAIDFDDQIYIPTLFFPKKFTKAALLIVDEAQDLSALHHVMLQHIRTPNCQLIVAGDRNQSIYAFKGAHYNSMPELQQAHQLSPMGLTVSFRCPQAIVREAAKIVPEITAHPSAPEGSVRSITKHWSIHSLPPGSAILCRNNAPLFSLFSTMIKEGVPCAINGTDATARLISVIKGLNLDPNSSAKSLVTATHEWFSSKCESMPEAEANLSDIAESIFALAATSDTVQEILDILNLAFNQSNRDAITLSSIHRAKGLEWNDVYILNRGLIPNKYATTPEQLQQEQNLLYVATTRAKSNLTYINLKLLKERRVEKELSS